MSQPEITAIFLPNQVYLFEPFKSKYLIFSSELHIWVFSNAHRNVRVTEVLLRMFYFCVIFKWLHMGSFSGRYFSLYSTKSNGVGCHKKNGAGCHTGFGCHMQLIQCTNRPLTDLLYKIFYVCNCKGDNLRK